jgi:Transposase DDE domain
LIVQARTLYAGEDLGLELTNTVYALDSTTIDLCLSVFPWAHFRTTKVAVKMHTLLDLRGNIPSFIHISDGKLADVHALDLLIAEPGAIYVMDRAYVDFTRLYKMHQAGAFFVTRAKSNMKAHRLYSASTDRATGIICDQTITLDGQYSRHHFPGTFAPCPFQGPRERQGAGIFDQSLRPSLLDHSRPLQKSMAGGVVFQMDQAAPADQAVLWDLRECGEDADMDRRVGLRAGGHRQEAARAGCHTLHIDAGPFGDNIRKNADQGCTLVGNVPMRYCNRK